MRKTLPLFVLSIILSVQINAQSLNTVWTKKYEDSVYQQYYSLTKGKIRDEFTRIQFSKCCVEKTKILMPNGLASLSETELYNFSNNITASCAAEIRNNLIFKVWTPKVEEYLRSFFIAISDTAMDITYRTQMSDCMIEKLKIIYPDGLDGVIPDDVEVDLSSLCTKEIMKFLTWTPKLEESFKASFKEIPQIKQLKPAAREAVCNCYISKAKNIYPNGLPNGKISKSASIQIFRKCPIKQIEHSLQ